MTFTFKLARRLARFRAIAGTTAILLTVSCADDGGLGSTASDPLSPTAGPSVGISSTDELTTSASKGGNSKGRGRGRNTQSPVSVSPESVRLAAGAVQTFTATATRADGSTWQPAVKWTATGGTVDSNGQYTAGSNPGQYRVVAIASDGVSDTATASVVDDPPAVERVVLTPATASVTSGETQQFTAVGKASDGSTVSITPAYTAKGGTITASGLYTAGQTVGTYRVIATDPASGKADTGAVTIEPSSPSLQAVVLTPANVSLVPGGSQQFTVSGKMSDGSTAPISASFAATGGTISSSGVYSAGSTAGSFRVIATQAGGTLADTAVVSITASSPPPTSGTTYFRADAESGTLVPPWANWGVYNAGGAIAPVSSTTRAKTGSRAWKFEITNPAYSPNSSSSLATPTPQTSMGCQSDHFCTGYYSFWAYVDAGWNNPAWNVMVNFLGVLPSADPIGHVGLSVRDGVLQMYWSMKNCQVGRYVCPNVAGYQNSDGDYLMTPSSPAGVVAFPRNQWVHVAIYYKLARTNGQVQIWQNGVKIEDITASTLNTRDGHQVYNNTGNDMMIGVGIYNGPNADTNRRLYVDDFMVTNYRPVP